MAEVTGSIGNEHVELNNAATEATLKLLLQSSLTANKQSIDNIKNLAQKSGLDPAAVAAANQGLKATTAQTSVFKAAAFEAGRALGTFAPAVTEIVSLSRKLVADTAQASDVFASLSKLPLGIGLVASGFQQLALFQEKQFLEYQKLTQVGINFGGSLTDLRMAASSTYMTMDQFTNLATKNSESFARLGTTTDAGIKSFVRVSKEFQDSQAGANLRALGITTDQSNEALIKFMALQGKAGTQNAQTVAAVQASTAGYLEELDRLTKLTGVSKQKLEEEQKKADMNAAYQRKLLSLAPEEQAKLKAAYDKAAASGIKGATDLIMTTALGLPPLTEEAKTLTGVFPEAAAGLTQMTNTAITAGTSQADVSRDFGTAMNGAVEGSKRLTTAGDALVMMNGKQGAVINSAIAVQNMAAQKGMKSAEDWEKGLKEAGATQKTQQESEAAAAAQTQQELRKLGEQILNDLMPVVKDLIPYLNSFVKGLSDSATWMEQHKKLMESLAVVVGGVLAGMVAWRTFLAVQAARNAVSAAGGGIKGIAAALSGAGPLGSATNPMHVVIAGGKAGIFGELLESKTGAKAGVEAGEKAVEKAAEKAGAKGLTKLGGKALAKFIPGVGFVAGAYDAYDRASQGDYLGAGIAGLGGLASFIPGVGGAVAAGLDVANLGRDLYRGSSNNVPASPSGSMTPEQASALGIPSSSIPVPGSSVPTPEKTVQLLIDLNNKQAETLKAIKDIADNTRRNVDATRGLSGNLFPTN